MRAAPFGVRTTSSSSGNFWRMRDRPFRRAQAATLGTQVSAAPLGLAMPRAPATELVFWHRAPTAPPKDEAFSSLFRLFSISLFLSAFTSFEVTVTSVSLPFLCVAVFLIQANVSLSSLWVYRK